MGCSPWVRKESDTIERLHFLCFLSPPHVFKPQCRERRVSPIKRVHILNPSSLSLYQPAVPLSSYMILCH